MDMNNNLACPNVCHSDGKGISMDAKRAERFTSAMLRIFRAKNCLDAAAGTFARYDLSKGEMDPAMTVRAFADLLDKDIQLLFEMIDNAEEPEAATEGEA
jgi:hypothetical protein